MLQIHFLPGQVSTCWGRDLPAALGRVVSFSIFPALPFHLPALFCKHIYCWRAPGPLGPQPFILEHLTFTLPALSLSCLIPFNFLMSFWSL